MAKRPYFDGIGEIFNPPWIFRQIQTQNYPLGSLIEFSKATQGQKGKCFIHADTRTSCYWSRVSTFAIDFFFLSSFHPPTCQQALEFCHLCNRPSLLCIYLFKGKFHFMRNAQNPSPLPSIDEKYGFHAVEQKNAVRISIRGDHFGARNMKGCFQFRTNAMEQWMIPSMMNSFSDRFILQIHFPQGNCDFQTSIVHFPLCICIITHLLIY